jgi:serine/threonine protein kinase
MDLRRKVTILDQNKNPISFTLEKELGSGAFGIVFLIHIKGKKYALKIVNKKRFKNPDAIKREVNIIQKIIQSYPQCKKENHLLCYKYIYEDERNIYFISDLMDGELFDYIQSKSFLRLDNCEKVNVIWKITTEIIKGLESLHRIGIVHRDIKMENILFKKSKEGIQFAIADFGLGCMIDECSWGSGTYPYLPPQSIFDKKSQTFRDDYYGLGVVLFMMLTDLEFTSFSIKQLKKDFKQGTINYNDIIDIYQDNYQKITNILDQLKATPIPSCSLVVQKKKDRLIELSKYLVNPNPKYTITMQNIKKIIDQ